MSRVIDNSLCLQLHTLICHINAINIKHIDESYFKLETETKQAWNSPNCQNTYRRWDNNIQGFTCICAALPWLTHMCLNMILSVGEGLANEADQFVTGEDLILNQYSFHTDSSVRTESGFITSPHRHTHTYKYIHTHTLGVLSSIYPLSWKKTVQWLKNSFSM